MGKNNHSYVSEQKFNSLSKAAESGDLGSMFDLAACYAEGEGVEKDKEKAFYWWQKAAQQGYANAQLRLGFCYANGDGVKRDEKNAIFWMEKAAMQGHIEAHAHVALMYAGNGNMTKANKWIQRLADQGYDPSVVLKFLH